MSKTRWTDDQLAAIYTGKAAAGGGCNILVNAAAGSGKTAVLVERIIQKLIPNAQDASCIDVDRLLVVTFTNAAAAEMRQRVSDALARELAAAEDAERVRLLKRQLSLVHSADITTIDSFCLKAVRNYFHLLHIDPNFTIATGAELELMKDEAMETLFDALYEEENGDFLELACLYTNGRDDEGLRELVKEIYNFTRSFPDPRGWMEEKRDMFLLPEGAQGSVWMQDSIAEKDRLIDTALQTLEDALAAMARASLGREPAPGEAARLMEQHPAEKGDALFDDWGSYYQAVKTDYQAIAALRGLDWDGACHAVRRLEFGRINARGLKYRELTEGVKEQINTVRKKLTGQLRDVVGRTVAETETQLREHAYPAARKLVWLTEQFEDALAELKDSKNALEFSDIEHLCLELFENNPEVAAEFRGRYEEILMDEYQDSNALQEAIFNAISRGDNLFMVGDMKQSIYRFRSADPTIFKQKNDTYDKAPGAKNRKIVLSRNFRSRREVLDGANAVFARVMSERAGELEYDADQRLYLGDESYEQANPSYLPECCVIEGYPKNAEETLEKLDKTRLEARFIAQKIRELKETGFLVRDFETRMVPAADGGFREEKKAVYRPVQNRDIAILMSSHRSAADVYRQELASYGTECFVETGGYFEREEVKTVLALIKIIGNPYQDIPLLAVLRSPIGGFDEHMLAQIRTRHEGAFYKALKAASEEDTALGRRCGEFTARLARWRRYSKYMSSDKLIWTLFEETQYYMFCGALPEGDALQANLRMLFERAKLFEKSGYKGLFNFIRYISRIRRKEEDLSAACMLGEQHDVVRIMTIHKSKGLEFPIVFLAGTAKEFYSREHTGSVILHKDLGFGMDDVNFEESYRIPTLSKTAVAVAIQREGISEEIRKLYVALTRAKEKLFVTAVVDGRNMEDAAAYAASGAAAREQKWDGLLAGARMDPQDVLAVRTFIDWVAPVARKDETWEYAVIPYEEVLDYRPVLREPAAAEDAEDIGGLLEQMEYRYPYEEIEALPTKVSVTGLKQLKTGRAEELTLRRRPAFMEEQGPVRAAEAGTAVHLVLQKLPPAAGMEEAVIKQCISDLTTAQELTEAEAAAVDTEKLLRYYRSDLVRRMLESGKVYREVPFEAAFPAAGLGLHPDSGEPVILQGMIDCYFEEDGGITLVDYKTDFYRHKEELAEKYRVQLELYARAIEKITKKIVKHKILYLFFGNDVIEY